MHLDLLLGPPGTGKTTRLVEEVRAFLAKGGAPDEVAIVSFTQAAANEARERVCQVLSLDPNDLPHVRTVHSLAYRALKIRRDDVLDRKAMAQFCAWAGEEITGLRAPEEEGQPPAWAFRTATPGDAYLRALEVARATGRPLGDTWRWLDETDGVPGTSAEGCRAFADAYRTFKQQTGLLDFGDMLGQYMLRGAPLDGVRFAVIDEAQDLTAVQWEVVLRAFAPAERLLVAGDDDQTIYAFAGARASKFLDIGMQARHTEVLHQSHRLPAAVHAVATDIVGRITMRFGKPFRPRPANGQVMEHGSIDTVPLERDGSTRILARNAYLLDAVEARLRDFGHVYTRGGRPSVHPADVRVLRAWAARPESVRGDLLKPLCAALGFEAPHGVMPHALYRCADHGIDMTRPWDAAFAGWSQSRRAYYAAVLAEGRKLSEAPRIHLSTIHAAKGAEAEHVVLLTEMSAKSSRSLETNADDEHRVFYVGVTRASETLDLVHPSAGRGYPLDF